MISGVGIGGWVCLSVAWRLVLESIVSGGELVIVECNVDLWKRWREEMRREREGNESEVSRLGRYLALGCIYVGNLGTPPLILPVLQGLDQVRSSLRSFLRIV